MYTQIPLPALLPVQGSDDEPLSLTRRRENKQANARIVNDWATSYGIDGSALGLGMTDDAYEDAIQVYRTVALYNQNLAHIESWLAGGTPHNWNPRFPDLPRPAYPSFNEFIRREIADGNIVMNGALPMSLTSSGIVSGNTGADAYRTTFFWHTPNRGDVFSIAPLVVAAIFVGAAVGGYLAAYTVGAEAGAGGAVLAAEAGAVGATEVGTASAWEAAAVESAAWEAASAEALTSWSVASAEVAAAESAAWAAASAEAAAIEAATFEPMISWQAASAEVAATAPSALPASGGGFSFPSAQQIAQKALPYALKELTKPSGPTAPPRSAAPVPAAIGFSPGSPQYDVYGRELTSAVDNTMLYVLGGLALALVAAVTLDVQRKG